MAYRNNNKDTRNKKNTRKPFNPKKGKGNKRYDRDVEVADTAAKDLEGLSKTNDPSWYARNPKLLEEATRLPFAWPLGVPYALQSNVDGVDDCQVNDCGVCTVYFTPTIGVSTTLQSPANTAARQIYTYVRNMNSGSKNYDQADLMMYLTAMDSLYMFHSVVRKIVGLAKTYTPTDRYFPRALLSSMGVDPDDVFTNIADWLYFCNQCAYQIGMTTAPASMTYFTRHMWMASGVYMDSNTSKPQVFQFMPSALWKFNNLGATGTSLTPVMMTKVGLMKLSDYRALFTTLMSQVIGDEDFAVMSGDILKAFGPDGVMKLSNTGDDYIVYPVYDETVLMQIHNSIACGPLSQTSAITQNPSVNNGAVTCSIVTEAQWDNMYANAIPATYQRLLNLRTEDASPAAIIEATRLMPMITTAIEFNGDKGAPTLVTIDEYGSEVVNYYKVMSANRGVDGGFISSTLGNGVAVITDSGAEGWPAVASAASTASAFDWFPFLYVTGGYKVGTYTPSAMAYPIGDLCYFTHLDQKTLHQMHEVAMLSEFDVPQMGFNKA